MLVEPDGSFLLDAERFTTKRDLLVALTGHPEGRHWSLDRYFGLGRHARLADFAPGDMSALDLFGPVPGSVATWQPGVVLAPSVEAITFDCRITAPRPAALQPTATPLIVDSSGAPAPRLGIDLVRRGGEVAKLLFAGFGRRIHAAGYDPDDVLQQVYLGLVARNQGRCPWDPRKSSFGHYVHMVCGCVLANYHRKQRGVNEHEQLGMLCSQGSGEDDAERQRVDVAQGAVAEADVTQELQEAHRDLLQHLRQEAPLLPKELALIEAVVPLLAVGYTRKEAAERVGVSAPTVGRALGLVRPYVQSHLWGR